MLFDSRPFNFCRRMAGKTVASAIGHFFGIGGMALDTRFHGAVAAIGINRLHQLWMTAHTIARTP